MAEATSPNAKRSRSAEDEEYLGEHTISAHLPEKNKTDLPLIHAQFVDFYSGWFCPYAQRVWIALEEKGVPYTWHEIALYLTAQDGSDTKTPKSLEEKRREYPAFVGASPRGLVPALVDRRPIGGHSGPPGVQVCESLICVDYVNEISAQPSLMPRNAMGRAKVRLAIDCISSRIIPHFYKMLMNQDEAAQEEAKTNLLAGLLELSGRMEPSVSEGGSGDFIMGDLFTVADIALAPWCPQRFDWILGTYRGFEIPSTPEYDRCHAWARAVRSRESVARTMVSRERLVANYMDYANNKATSAVASAFREAGVSPAKRTR